MHNVSFESGRALSKTSQDRGSAGRAFVVREVAAQVRAALGGDGARGVVGAHVGEDHLCAQHNIKTAVKKNNRIDGLFSEIKSSSSLLY